MNQPKGEHLSKMQESSIPAENEHATDSRVLEITARIQLYLKEFQTNFYFIKDNFSLEQLENNLNPLEYAGYNAFLAYSLCSLFYAYLKTSGAFLNNHPIKSEIKRVQQLMRQIKETSEEMGEGKEKETVNYTVNKQALKRIVDSCVSYNKNVKRSRKE